MPKSSEMDRTEVYNKPEGENKTSESWPTISASHNKKSSKTQRKKAKANAKAQEIKNLFGNQEPTKKDDILKGLFTNPEFPQHKDNTIEFSEPEPDIVWNFTIIIDSPILEQFEYLLKEQ